MPGYRVGRAFSKDEEKEMLDTRLKMMETQKDAIKKRLGGLGF